MELLKLLFFHKKMLMSMLAISFLHSQLDKKTYFDLILKATEIFKSFVTFVLNKLYSGCTLRLQCKRARASVWVCIELLDKDG